MSDSIKQKIPNAITLARLLLSLVLFGLLHIFQYSSLKTPMWYLDACCVLFLVASLTDFLDGYLARKWNVVSVFGRIVDPFVDKILVLGTFAYLAGSKLGPITGVTATIVVLLLGRELLVTALRSKSEGGGQNFAAAMSGKIKMVLQCVAIVACFLLASHGSELNEDTLRMARIGTSVLVWATVIVTWWSGWLYVKRAMA